MKQRGSVCWGAGGRAEIGHTQRSLGRRTLRAPTSGYAPHSTISRLPADICISSTLTSPKCPKWGNADHRAKCGIQPTSDRKDTAKSPEAAPQALPRPCDESGERADGSAERRMHRHAGKTALSKPSGRLRNGVATWAHQLSATVTPTERQERDKQVHSTLPTR